MAESWRASCKASRNRNLYSYFHGPRLNAAGLGWLVSPEPRLANGLTQICSTLFPSGNRSWHQPAIPSHLSPSYLLLMASAKRTSRFSLGLGHLAVGRRSLVLIPRCRAAGRNRGGWAAQRVSHFIATSRRAQVGHIFEVKDTTPVFWNEELLARPQCIPQLWRVN